MNEQLLVNMNNIRRNTGPGSFVPSKMDSSQIADCKTSERRRFSASDSMSKQSAPPHSHEIAPRSDAQLISSVCCDSPDEEALGALVNRHWGYLFARCQMLTLNQEEARDLAQSTWCRLLRARQGLKPDGNFPAYLATIATNLFRDSYRASRRAGPMADYRLESLDAPHTNDGGETVVLVDMVADIKSLQPQAQTLLAIDIDRALERLTPQLRDVVIARFIDGESCAEIGLRYGRTEQTVSGWVRDALRQMKTQLEEPPRAAE